MVGRKKEFKNKFVTTVAFEQEDADLMKSKGIVFNKLVKQVIKDWKVGDYKYKYFGE